MLNCKPFRCRQRVIPQLSAKELASGVAEIDPYFPLDLTIFGGRVAAFATLYKKHVVKLKLERKTINNRPAPVLMT